jgi:hypothetical protein
MWFDTAEWRSLLASLNSLVNGVKLDPKGPDAFAPHPLPDFPTGRVRRVLFTYL